MTRERWKQLWRVIRIARREYAKSYMDVMCYGTGMVRITTEGVEHCPIRLVPTPIYSALLRQARK